MVEAQKLTAFATLPLIKELNGVLNRSKFKFIIKSRGLKVGEYVIKYLSLVKIVPYISSIKLEENETPSDIKDSFVIKSAISASVDALISGDSDILALKHVRGISVLSPTDFFLSL